MSEAPLYEKACQTWPELENVITVGRFHRETTLGQHILVLNDEKDVSREDIANGLEELGL